ncbi:response regulator transcription factor [Paenibacillus donghaensis]|uniref:DNA-binding response regulator n=1 Tax=Paenibacillus donghaensis TaxID=414771 RepID=A0A2Z2KUQ7_9BACL|nr:response regulator transcription factor [Paenibacillus donghaensis]ASA25862.1 DNA-binding response regulator [Paenibacillus donghaensis]
MKETILIVDDEQDIVTMLQEFLLEEGYEVWTAGDGRAALLLADRKPGPDLILLDVMMPGMDGFSVCREIRDRVGCPILFLTARVEEADHVLGLSLGGDDYILKPFNISELAARISAHLRRERRKTSHSSRVYCGKMWIDYAARLVGCGTAELPLARKEYEVLELLSLHAGQVFSRERIYERVWGYDAAGDPQAVTEHVKRLRGKLAQIEEESHVETVWGVGYRWR